MVPLHGRHLLHTGDQLGCLQVPRGLGHGVFGEAGASGGKKYLDLCLEMWRDFTSLVYSVDAMAGKEARAAYKSLVCLLS